jgi:signal transduction histidine kinase
MALDLRARVAAAIAISSIAVVSALAITLYDASEDLEESLVEQIVSEEMIYLMDHYHQHPDIARESSPNLQQYVVRTPADLDGIPAALRALSAGNHEIGQGSAERHVAVRDVNGVRFIVAYDSGAHEVREQQFKRLVLFALATVVIVATVLGYWIAGLITRQITDLATRVANPQSDTSPAPLTQPGQDAEVAKLAQAFDRYRQRMQAMITREQEFTGNASHELRTPLTAIRTSCELLESEPGLSDRALTRIAAISAAAARMTDQIEVLLLLARSASLAQRETVYLAECIDAAVEPWRAEIQRKNLRFDNGVAPHATAQVNRQALALVLANLLRNAVQYTAGGSISVRWEAPVLTVADSGPGIAPDTQPHVFDRFYRGTAGNTGSGLGLSIVKRACDHCGWQITVDTPETGGSAFHLTLC